MLRIYPEFIAGRGAVGLLLVRVATGAGFIAHGLRKLQSEQGWTSWADPELGLPAAVQGLASFAEFGGGIALILGLLTPLACLGIANNMVGAMVTVHLPKGNPFVAPMSHASYEIVIVYLSIVLMLILVGPGTLSLDALFFRRPPEKPAVL